MEKRDAKPEEWVNYQGSNSILPQSNQVQVLLVTGTTSQVHQVLPFLAQQKEHQAIPSQVQIMPASPKRKELPWPKWDGDTETFSFFGFRLRVKIEEDLDMLGSNRAICYSMLGTLPEEKQSRVAHWFRQGGENGAYDWRLFLEFFHNKFENKQACVAAGHSLLNMRQGSHQYFRDFIHDFECKLAQCAVGTWDSSSKVRLLEISINETLSRVLIGATLPPDSEYEKWVARVQQVASNLEMLSSYRPENSTQTTTWYISCQNNNRQNTTDIKHTKNTDNSEDTKDAKNSEKSQYITEAGDAINSKNNETPGDPEDDGNAENTENIKDTLDCEDTPPATLPESSTTENHGNIHENTTKDSSVTIIDHLATTLQRITAVDTNPEGESHDEIQAPNEQSTKPRAPWLPRSEFRRLMDQGLCTRCAGSNHLSVKCPNMRPALRPSFAIRSGINDEDQ